MKVWLVTYHDYDEVWTEGVYMTEQRAKLAIETFKLEHSFQKRSNFSVSEWEVE